MRLVTFWRSELLTRAALLRLTAARRVAAGSLAVTMGNGARLRKRPGGAVGILAVHTRTAGIRPMPVVLVVRLEVAAARCLLSILLFYFMAYIGWFEIICSFSTLLS